MRVRDVGLALAVCVIAAIAFKRGRGARGQATPPVAPAPPAAQQSAGTSIPAPQGQPSVASDAVASDAVASRGSEALARDLATIQERLREGAPGTYIMHMLSEQKHLLMRWPDRVAEPLRVWIQPAASIPDWSPTYPVAAERAFEEWRAAGFPIRFDMIRDSAGADIQIRFVQQMPPEDSARIGAATKQYELGGTIVRGFITIATHDRRGRPIQAETVTGTARHEVGHVLGLGHSDSPTDVMYPESRTAVISRADRATLHLLYTLPPGPVR